jgi:WhiB family redox-sensing transcriptional regulator
VTIQQLGYRSNDRVDASWRDHAACRFAAPELFFPAGTTGVALDEIEAAKAVCKACPVQDACLRFAFETKQEDGIWGGTTEDERRRLRRAWLADRRRRAVARA